MQLQSRPKKWRRMEINRRKYGDLASFIKNPICKVLWAGWETDTLALQRAGWQLAMEQDPMRDCLQLIMKHEPCRLYALSEPIQYHYFRMNDLQTYTGDVVFQIKWMASRFEVLYHADMGNFRAVNAKPMMAEVDMRRKDIEDFNLFTPLVDTQELLVEPKDVKECLDKILKFQSPKQQELKEKKRRAMRRQEGEICDQVDPLLNVHAQIITLAS